MGQTTASHNITSVVSLLASLHPNDTGKYGVLKYTVGHTLKDISEYIGVRYTTVSRVIKKIEREDEK